MTEIDWPLPSPDVNTQAGAVVEVDREALKEDGSRECLLPDPVTNRWCDHHLAENACTPSSARYSMRSRHLAALRVTVAVWEGGLLCRPSRVRQPWRERSRSCKKHSGSYSDYTGYMPVNTVEAVIDPNR